MLQYDAVNAEAIACLASHHFYTDQPELALRFYRRMLQNGVTSAATWFTLLYEGLDLKYLNKCAGGGRGWLQRAFVGC